MHNSNFFANVGTRKVLSKTFSQNINYCSVAFSLLFGIVLLSLFEKILFITCDQKESLKRIFIYFDNLKIVKSAQKF